MSSAAAGQCYQTPAHKEFQKGGCFVFFLYPNTKYALMLFVDYVKIYGFSGGPNVPKICGQRTKTAF